MPDRRGLTRTLRTGAALPAALTTACPNCLFLRSCQQAYQRQPFLSRVLRFQPVRLTTGLSGEKILRRRSAHQQRALPALEEHRASGDLRESVFSQLCLQWTFPVLAISGICVSGAGFRCVFIFFPLQQSPQVTLRLPVQPRSLVLFLLCALGLSVFSTLVISHAVPPAVVLGLSMAFRPRSVLFPNSSSARGAMVSTRGDYININRP